MSVPRITEILETQYAGWTSALVSATGAQSITVKTGAGFLGYVLPQGSNVTPKDGSTALWGEIGASGIDITSTPVRFSTSLVIAFGGSGSCRVLYK